MPPRISTPTYVVTPAQNVQLDGRQLLGLFCDPAKQAGGLCGERHSPKLEARCSGAALWTAHERGEQGFVNALSLADEFLSEEARDSGPSMPEQRSKPTCSLSIDIPGWTRTPNDKINQSGHEPIGKGTIGPPHPAIKSEQKLRFFPRANAIREYIMSKLLNVTEADMP